MIDINKKCVERSFAVEQVELRRNLCSTQKITDIAKMASHLPSAVSPLSILDFSRKKLLRRSRIDR
jgi:hypothetical protein